MPYTLRQIVDSAISLAGLKGEYPQVPDAIEWVNDGLDEIQDRTAYYRVKDDTTFPADQSYAVLMTDAADYLDQIFLIMAWNGTVPQMLFDTPDRMIRSLADGVASEPSNDTVRTFTLQKSPAGETFGTVWVLVDLAFSSNTDITLEYLTRPPRIDASDEDATINAPRRAMLYYLAWRVAETVDDPKDHGANAARLWKKFEETCERVEGAMLATKARLQGPAYDSFLSNIRTRRY